MFTFIAKIKKAFEQPITYRLRVIDISQLDLRKYHNSLGYFIEEVIWPDTSDQFLLLKKNLVYLGADEQKDGTIITVSFMKDDITIEEVIQRLSSFGISVILSEQ